MLTSIAALAAILLFAFFLNGRCKVNASLTPLLSIVLIIDTVMLFAMFGMLKAGTTFAYLMAVIAAGYEIYTNKAELQVKIYDFFTPGVVLFITSSLAMLWILSATQPVFHGWDEFSFWGMAAKIVDKFDALYTYHNTSMLGQSIPPAMPVTTYFFNFFGGEMAEWVCYFGYDVLFMACFAAFTAPFGKKDGHKAAMVYAIAFLTPFMFEITDISSKLTSTYISAYGDIPMALVFAAAVAVYYHAENGGNGVLYTLPVLMFLTLIKDMGFALSCIVCFVVFFDMLVARKGFTFAKLKGFFAKCAAAATMLLVTGGSFVGWSAHISKVLNINRNDFSESTSIGMAEMLIRGLTELFGEKEERFTDIYNSMIAAFFETKVSMFGVSLNVVIIITLIFAAAFIFGKKDVKKSAAMMYLTTWTGFAGYYVFHLFLYAYLFKNDGYDLASYDRYMYIFYIGWLLIALTCLVRAAGNDWIKGANLSITGILLIFIAVFNLYTDMGNTFAGANSISFPKRELIRQKAEFISDAIGEDDVIYIASEENGGENWFIYTYELLDNYIVQDYFIWWEADTQEGRDAIAHSVMADYFQKHGVTHLMVDNVNDEYIRRYSHCFDTDISRFAGPSMGYFKLHFTDDSFYATLVKGGGIND